MFRTPDPSQAGQKKNGDRGFLTTNQDNQTKPPHGQTSRKQPARPHTGALRPKGQGGKWPPPGRHAESTRANARARAHARTHTTRTPARGVNRHVNRPAAVPGRVSDLSRHASDARARVTSSRSEEHTSTHHRVAVAHATIPSTARVRRSLSLSLTRR